MQFQDRRSLKQTAGQRLASAAFDPRKLVLIHTGVTVGASLLGSLLSFLLTLQIEQTGGLSGLAQRSTLETVQTVIQVMVTALLPFWEAGFLYAALRIARREPAEPQTLLQGFLSFAPLLRAYLLQGLLFVLAAIACYYFSMQIFLFTPLSAPMVDIMAELSPQILAGSTPMLDDAAMAAFVAAAQPLMVIFAVLLLVVALVIVYQFRFVNYLLLEHPGMKARAAMRQSRSCLRGKKKHLILLDLSFWWFYLLQTLASLLAYGDYLLPLFGVSLPFSSEVAFVVFLVLSLICQGGLYLLARNRVEVTYALFYCDAVPPQKTSA